MNTPPSNYDGNVSGVINIVLKTENDTGFSGHFFTEIPTSKSIVYSFPNYRIQYGFKKVTLFTSYNGEITSRILTKHIKDKSGEPGRLSLLLLLNR